MSASLPANVRVSKHPVIHAKLSQLRSRTLDTRLARLLADEIASLLAYEATATSLTTQIAGQGETPIGAAYDVLALTPGRLCLVPILRSGLAMTDPFLRVLPTLTEVHHLGLFREEHTQNAIEYYNKVPKQDAVKGPIEQAFLVDPIVATGNTACAAIQILKEWGIKKIVLTCMLASEAGLRRAAAEWPEGVEIVVGAVDAGLTDKLYITPGLGDIGDRLFQTK
ncbi:uracil phosphoribosyltransferase [Protomyces lactucae-debilis]|uniref:uracil phosphoribosyltransferase n=1 Tax=Protomyces lactucae-debilis TaxID=2754530 RepID=A0A1Y2FQK5_PROLT|nr:uracil phosphoribosyltransferase [Protomyces lactucae-debilis]ORY86273.1 uracil phosphoribosyltransferase [Protomyces lactucae-debilis]